MKYKYLILNSKGKVVIKGTSLSPYSINTLSGGWLKELGLPDEVLLECELFKYVRRNGINRNDNTTLIPLHGKYGFGQFCIVDAEDADKVLKHSWALDKGYPVSRINDKKTLLHHFLIGKPPKNKVVDHINRNKLDARKSNLRFATHAENVKNSDRVIRSKKLSKSDRN